jgi:hypothetical protein
MYRFVVRQSCVQSPKLSIARRYCNTTSEPATEEVPLGVTEENELTVKRRTRKPRAPKVPVVVAPPVQPSGLTDPTSDLILQDENFSALTQ